MRCPASMTSTLMPRPRGRLVRPTPICGLHGSCLPSLVPHRSASCQRSGVVTVRRVPGRTLVNGPPELVTKLVTVRPVPARTPAHRGERNHQATPGEREPCGTVPDGVSFHGMQEVRGSNPLSST
jgi:hypothetical protein